MIKMSAGTIRIGVLTLCVSLASAFAIAAYDLELPEEPAGFKWKKFEEIKAALLVPDGWYFKQVQQEDTVAYFITKENIDEVGRFDTGLSMNVIRGRDDLNAVLYAEEFIETMAAQNELVREWTTGAGLLKGFGCLTRNAVEGEDVSIMMHTLAIGNEETNTLYILFFESLEEEWDQAWKYGEQILRMFLMDDEI